MQSEIRTANQKDAPAVLACVRAAYAKYVPRIGKEPAPMLADYDTLIDQGDVYILQGAMGLRAVLVMRNGEDGMFLENIAVHPDFQGAGIGRQLMQFVEDSARARRLPAIDLYTNELMSENLAFYTRLGFIELDRRTVDGYRRVFFRKQL